MFDEKIVPGSSPQGKDRPRHGTGDDVEDGGDDQQKKIAPHTNKQDEVKTKRYGQRDDGDERDDDSPPPFQNHLREGII
jgi:hypothetical protein